MAETEGAGVLRLDGKPLVTSRDVAAYFDVQHGRLLWVLYKAPESTRYRHFEIPKRTGGMRPIDAPHGMLRRLQDKLKVDLDKVYNAHPNAHGFIAERSVATNAARHVGKRWVLNIDLADFFPSVNFGRVRGLFLKPPFEMGPAAATVCAQIATLRNGLPQGAPTSPVISNLIAVSLDRNLLRLARQHRLAYSRYADDITLSCDDPLPPVSVAVREPMDGGGYRAIVGDALEQAVTVSGFSINLRKIRLQGRGVRQSVTGLSVNARVNVARTRIRRLRAMLHAWRKFGLEPAAREHFTRFRRMKPSNGPRDPGRAFRNIVYGHLSFVKMVRGREDPLFLKLCAQVLDLDPNPSKFIRQMVFGADDFEVFISHATEDKPEVARPIFEACTRAGIKAFLDEAHIGWGESFTKKINTALGASRTVLAVVSPSSVAKEWPVAEVNAALALEISGHKRVLVVLVGNPDLSKLPLVKTKNYHIWDGDAGKVAAALKRLAKPERTGEAPPAKRASGPAAAARPQGGPGPDAAAGPPMDVAAVAKRAASAGGRKRGFWAWLLDIR